MFHKSIDTFININTSVIKPSLFEVQPFQGSKGSGC